MTHQFAFTAISKIILCHEEGAAKSSLSETKLSLEHSKNLEKDKYINAKGTWTKDGMKPLDQALVQGLLTSIKVAHEKGWMKEGEHLKYIIDELQRAFIHPTFSKPEIHDGERFSDKFDG